VEGDWKRMKGKVKEQWGKLTDFSCDATLQLGLGRLSRRWPGARPDRRTYSGFAGPDLGFRKS
jgi:hypothetical protein